MCIRDSPSREQSLDLGQDSAISRDSQESGLIVSSRECTALPDECASAAGDPSRGSELYVPLKVQAPASCKRGLGRLAPLASLALLLHHGSHLLLYLRRPLGQQLANQSLST